LTEAAEDGLIMDTTEVMALIEANQNADGIERWAARSARPDRLKSFGIGLTRLRKLAKEVGRDHGLAAQLWRSDVYDARILSILIDDPKQMTREQAEAQVEQMDQGQLEHVFCACGAPLAKTPFVVELAGDWVKSDHPIRRSCGYGLLYELSKLKTKSAPDETFFLKQLTHLHQAYDSEPRPVQISMGGALMGIGKRTAKLNTAALKIARNIGPIELEADGGKCEPFDVAKHLTSDYIKTKLGV
jgi:3-methyladenine DNA glycosylase AlkD